MPRHVNGWDAAKDLVIARLEEMHKDIKELREKEIPWMREEIRELKVKARVWGALSGAIGGALAALLAWMTQGRH